MKSLAKLFFLSCSLISCNPKPLINNLETGNEGVSNKLENLDLPQETKDKLIDFLPAKIELPSKCESIQIQNLAPWVISRRNVLLNNFKISDYRKFENRGQENQFYSYYISGENKHILLSLYIGLVVVCSKQGEFLVPQKVYFKRKDQNFACMDIEYLKNQTKFIYKNSCVVVNNNAATHNSFDLKASHVDIESLSELMRNLQETTALQFIKFFLDCAACKNCVKIVYSDDKYFSYEYNLLGNQYCHLEDPVEDAKKYIQQKQQLISNAQDHEHELYLTKLFVEFRMQNIEAVKHVMLLILYKGSWFILDTNGGRPSYMLDNKGNPINFMMAVHELGINWCVNNDFFIQTGNACDTCASIMSYFFSEYQLKNKEFPIKNKNIDFRQINSFLQNKNLDKLKQNFFKI